MEGIILRAVKKEHLWIQGATRHMIWLRGDKEWEVLHTKSGKSLCQTPSSDTAVDFLLGKRS